MTQIGLAMSRSLGDLAVKPIGVTSEPEITEHAITAGDKFMIMASDGVSESPLVEHSVVGAMIGCIVQLVAFTMDAEHAPLVELCRYCARHSMATKACRLSSGHNFTPRACLMCALFFCPALATALNGC